MLVLFSLSSMNERCKSFHKKFSNIPYLYIIFDLVYLHTILCSMLIKLLPTISSSSLIINLYYCPNIFNFLTKASPHLLSTLLNKHYHKSIISTIYSWINTWLWDIETENKYKISQEAIYLYFKKDYVKVTLCDTCVSAVDFF